MHPNPKVQLLINEGATAINQAMKNSPTNLRELLEAHCYLISQVAALVCKAPSSLEHLNMEEQTMLSLVNHSIRPIFEARRQVMLSQIPPVEKDLSKEQVLQQVKQMLFNKTMSPDEGLLLAGELVSTVTYLRSPTVENQTQVKEIEIQTLNHIKGKLSLALDAIQVEQGFITKQ